MSHMLIGLNYAIQIRVHRTKKISVQLICTKMISQFFYKPTKAAAHLIEQLSQQIQDALLVNQLCSDHLDRQHRVQTAAMSSTEGESYLSLEAAKDNNEFLALLGNLNFTPGKVIAAEPNAKSAHWAADRAIPASAPLQNSEKIICRKSSHSHACQSH